MSHVKKLHGLNMEKKNIAWRGVGGGTCLGLGSSRLQSYSKWPGRYPLGV
jgi:hypothetical protein